MQAHTSVKTIWGAIVEASRRPGSTFTLLDYSTLNEHFQIEHGTAFPANTKPEIKYLVIGRGGHANVPGNSGLTDLREHRIDNACLMAHLPVRVVPANADLPPDERDKYRLRRLETHKGQQWFVYYAFVIKDISTDIDVKIGTKTDGGISYKDFEAKPEQLNPQPVTIVEGVRNRSTDKQVSVKSPFPIKLLATDIAYIIEAVNLIHAGDLRYAQISEMGVVSGFDKTVTSNAGGTSISYTEVVAAQIYNFLGVDIKLPYASSGITMNFRIGTVLNYAT